MKVLRLFCSFTVAIELDPAKEDRKDVEGGLRGAAEMLGVPIS